MTLVYVIFHPSITRHVVLLLALLFLVEAYIFLSENYGEQRMAEHTSTPRCAHEYSLPQCKQGEISNGGNRLVWKNGSK